MSNTANERLAATSIKLRPDQATRALQLAHEQGISRSTWVRVLIDAELHRADKEHQS